MKILFNIKYSSTWDNENNPLQLSEGNIDTPEKARRVLELGCFSVVVGSIITRPQLITKRFVDCIEG